MSHGRPDDGGSKLSAQTLIVAGLASLTAAIVTSTFWQSGTPIAAAITPVIVAIASELYSRPARRISELGSRVQTRPRRFDEGRAARERAPVGGAPRRLPEAPPPLREPGPGQVRVYRTSSRPRRVHMKVAIVTAAIAFAIAAIVLTVPELVFGGSVATHRKTTFFGGHAGRHAKKHESTQTAPSSGTATQPSQSQTTSQPKQAPAQTTPEQTTTSTTPPAAGSPTPGGRAPAQTTPSQTPGQ